MFAAKGYQAIGFKPAGGRDQPQPPEP